MISRNLSDDGGSVNSRAMSDPEPCDQPVRAGLATGSPFDYTEFLLDPEHTRPLHPRRGRVDPRPPQSDSNPPRDSDYAVAAYPHTDPPPGLRLGRGRRSPGRREAVRPGAPHSLERLARRRLARPAASLQGRAGLPQADHQATAGPDPRAGDQSPVHPPAPQFLGRTEPPARRPRRSGLRRGRDAARDRRPRRRHGVPPRLRAQRLHLHRPERPDARAKKTTQVVRYTVDRRPPHRHRPGVEAADHRVGLRTATTAATWPSATTAISTSPRATARATPTPT